MSFATDLAELIDASLISLVPAYSPPRPPLNARRYQCSIDGCQNRAYAKGLCNAHYLRQHKGQPLDTPLRLRGRGIAGCIECGSPVGDQGGLGRCRRHYKALRGRVIRAICVEALGGRCRSCGGVYASVVFDFHHRGGTAKVDDISTLISTASIIRIAEEVAKCDLLCANCHRVEHHGT